MANNNYTVFVVEQRRYEDDSPPSSQPNYFIGGTDLSASNHTLILGYFSFVTMLFGQNADGGIGGATDNISRYTSPIAKMHSFIFNSAIGRNYYLNGKIFSPTGGNTTGLSSYISASIGLWSSVYFNGDIAEIIVFSKALTDQEREDVEYYLSTKYAISIP